MGTHKNGSKFFVAGWFKDKKNKILTVLDKDRYDEARVNCKGPGGRSDEYALYDQSFINVLTELAEKAFFTGHEIDLIVKRERDLDKSSKERVLVIEWLEECGYYVYDYSLSSNDLVFNRITKKMDYPRFFFKVNKLVERNEDKGANELSFVSEIKPLPEFIPSDPDITDPRHAIPLRETYEELIHSHKQPFVDYIEKLCGEDRPLIEFHVELANKELARMKPH
ncbi:hypothetical protein COB64_01820 [Candidatus Wolfebacteria bacterium]|nr:MAG: hypothetical protein COB64_01820 [Candidatus Wolfebacteria bacterium]